MYVIADMLDLEIPIPENLVVTISESKELILNLLESIPNMFANT
jgi:protein transport protein SEC24